MKKKLQVWIAIFTIAIIALGARQFAQEDSSPIDVEKGSHIVLIGNNLGSRMMNFGHFETEMHLRYPDSLLFIRNMADGGNTPGFRPHSSRKSPWAFPGAEKFYVGTELANASGSEGHFPYPDEWLSQLEADIIIAFFGYSESFRGEEGLENYKAELDAFIDHTLDQEYNGVSAPQLALVSPIAFEDLSGLEEIDLPEGGKINENLALYAEAMKEVAAKNEVHFVDTFTPTKNWFETTEEPMTIDGSQLTGEAYQRFATMLVDEVFGEKIHKPEAQAHKELVHEAVLEKNWMWHNDFKIPNGVHAYGRRYDPFGPDNYPYEIAKIREMTAIRDTAIWQALEGERLDLAAADEKTTKLPPVETNYDSGMGSTEYLYGEDALDKFHMAPGYEIGLFASEKQFEDLANPVQIAFDNEGRLWVAVMPSYPHYKPGNKKPNDKILILEDTNDDGKADKQTTFADGLHLPIGFELSPEGVYVSQGTNLMLYTDTDGDDKADKKEIIMSGFDDHDTHHAHSAYEADPSGAIYMGEGTFLHTNVETSYGTVRGTNGGFYRYNPNRRNLKRIAQLGIPNPWSIIFDGWGQNFYSETSGPAIRWMMPGTINPIYGIASDKSMDLVEEHRVRPTSGMEFISSRHFPDEVQGDLLINNTIGFLGTKQHKIENDGTGYELSHRQDLVWSEDKNFRPVEMKFAPDGSLYMVDWHNVLIGHMQHNARDPLRDHAHGRIYRITYPSRPLVEPAEIAGASIEQLLDNLKLPEYRTRYRTRRELRGREASRVISEINQWIKDLDENDPRYEHHLLEALWVTWGLSKVDEKLLRQLLKSQNYRARAAAVRVLRYNGHQVEDQVELLMQAAGDEHGRVRLEAIVAASWLDKEDGLAILEVAANKPMDKWIKPAYKTSLAHLEGHAVEEEEEILATPLEGDERDLFIKGKEVYSRDGFCITCHQPNGQGLASTGYPPLGGTKWVEGDKNRLIKLVLKGLHGPIEVLGKEYSSQVPMTPFGGMLNDKEVAAVLTYIRNSFENEAPAVSPEEVERVRSEIMDKEGFYSPDELLEQHPMED